MRSIYKVYFTLFSCLPTLFSVAQEKHPTAKIEPYYDLTFTQAERDSLLTGLQNYQKSFEAIHQFRLANNVPMSLVFDPIPVGMQLETQQKPIEWGLPKDVTLPANEKN